MLDELEPMHTSQPFCMLECAWMRGTCSLQCNLHSPNSANISLYHIALNCGSTDIQYSIKAIAARTSYLDTKAKWHYKLSARVSCCKCISMTVTVNSYFLLGSWNRNVCSYTDAVLNGWLLLMWPSASTLPSSILVHVPHAFKLWTYHHGNAAYAVVFELGQYCICCIDARNVVCFAAFQIPEAN